MKKVILTIAILVVPFLMTAQNSDKKNTSDELNTTINTEVKVTAKKKTEKISTNPLEQTQLNVIKSNDIISVKAYMKSLQIKGKATLNS